MANFKLIKLTRNKLAMVDNEDYQFLNKNKWCCAATGYAIRKKDNKTVYMHKEIIKTKLQVDHINGNPLDNRKCNLRIATHFENSKNRKKTKNCSSTYKGVDYQKRKGTWRARIKFNYKSIYLGDYISEIDAALAYDNAAEKYFGKFAKYNLRK